MSVTVEKAGRFFSVAQVVGIGVASKIRMRGGPQECVESIMSLFDGMNDEELAHSVEELECMLVATPKDAMLAYKCVAVGDVQRMIEAGEDIWCLSVVDITPIYNKLRGSD